MSADFFPEGSTPLPTDSTTRSLQKINALLEDISAGGGEGGSGGPVAWDDVIGKPSTVPEAPNDGQVYARKSEGWFSLNSSNSVLPAITPNTNFVGVTYAVSNGTWSGSPAFFIYQWQVSEDGITWSNISGATTSTFFANSSYETKYLRVSVAAVSGLGESSPAFTEGKGPFEVPEFPIEGLISWHFDDDGNGGVSLIDATGNGNNLTDSNDVGLTTGLINGAAAFDGTNCLSIEKTLSSELGLTFSLWLKADPEVGALALNGPNYGDYGLFYFNNELIVTFVGETSAILGNYTPSGDWDHLVFVVEDDYYTTYVNGSSIGSVSYTTFETQLIKIGISDFGEVFGSMELDEINIWDRALSGAEVSLLYNSGNGLAYPG